MNDTIIRITYTDAGQEIIADFIDASEFHDYVAFYLLRLSIPFTVTYA